jgi:CheY-like chemotaxis protein
MTRTSDISVLVIEDDEPKQRSIVSFLNRHLITGCRIEIAQSLSSALGRLTQMAIALAIVDMSLPTFDLTKDRRGGGQPQGFGGADILRFIDSETTDTRSVVVTQYEEFDLLGDGARQDLSALESLLKNDLDARFLGVIHYSSQHGPWQLDLLIVLKQLGLVKESANS